MRNKLIFKVFLIFVLGVLLFTLVPMNVYAEDDDARVLYIDGHKIETIYYGDGPATRALFNPSPFTFYGDHNGSTRYYDGLWMAMEVNALAPVLLPMYLDVYVYNTYTHHELIVWSNGADQKLDWIPLGNTGGSSADNYYYVDDSNASIPVTVDVRSYSWI